MNALTILHRPKSGKKTAESLTSCTLAPVWATCLREIAFVDEDPLDAGSAEIHREEAAIGFLLEILCGLHSPVVGETEVMGQFKNFLATIPPDHPLFRDPTLIPFIQTTVKRARANFLTATGGLGYGQIVRRWLRGQDDVVLWGFGNLGSEIWPWVREKTRGVVVRQARAADADVPFIVGGNPPAKAHIIAAPMSDEEVRQLANNSNLVIDLRESTIDHPRVRGLQELFAEIQKLRRQQEDVVPRCREFLGACLADYEARHQIRPFGWEDLCG